MRRLETHTCCILVLLRFYLTLLILFRVVPEGQRISPSGMDDCQGLRVQLYNRSLDSHLMTSTQETIFRKERDNGGAHSLTAHDTGVLSGQSTT